jgi:hypothetical protein
MKIKQRNKNIGNKQIVYGRKTIRSGEEGLHNKYSDDNLLRKCKHLIINSLMEFINDTIRRIYKENIGQGILIKKFFTMKQEQKKNTYIDYNKNFLNKELGDIFSEDICGRYTNFLPDHNKNLVNYLKNENNQKISELFTKIFNLTFKDVLNHINGKEEILEINGLKDIDTILEGYENEPKYYDQVKNYILNFEEIIEKKKSRKKRK